MSTEPLPVRESIREVSSNSWLIGHRLLLSLRPHPPPSGPSWGDGSGSFYSLSSAPSPPPASDPLPESSHITKVYDAGNASAVWKVGSAFIKVKIPKPHATREHVTLEHLHKKQSLSFAIPDVHYHDEFDGRYYIILSAIPGQTLSEAWPSMDETTKHSYVMRIVEICKELAAWQNPEISGVDGGYLSDLYLTRGHFPNLSPQSLKSNCMELGMDCSTLVFFHCDLGPGNIIVGAGGALAGILDWETAGFVPREWIRTKFRVSSGLNLPGKEVDEQVDWRRRVQRQLGEEGFPEIAKRWEEWWRNAG